MEELNIGQLIDIVKKAKKEIWVEVTYITTPSFKKVLYKKVGYSAKDVDNYHAVSTQFIILLDTYTLNKDTFSLLKDLENDYKTKKCINYEEGSVDSFYIIDDLTEPVSLSYDSWYHFERDSFVYKGYKEKDGNIILQYYAIHKDGELFNTEFIKYRNK